MSKGKSKGRGRDSSFTKDNQFYGLRNQGSTSYLNSVLQVLFMTEEFREAVKRHTEDNSNTTHIDRQLSELFDELKKGPAETIGITDKLGIRSVYKQSDAAEHFEKILALTSPEASKIFQGNLVHTTECLKCHNKTCEEGRFWHFPLPLEDYCGQSYSVEKGVAEFFQTCKLKGEYQLYCDGCGEKWDATIKEKSKEKKCEMKHHPDILTLLLKRFEFDYRYMSYTKNSCAVDVPYTLEVPQGQIYDLYAFVEHVGSLKSGHYTATVKSQDGRGARWYNFHDSSVTQLNDKLFNEDNKKDPYLLFYRKRKEIDPDIRERSTSSSARERDDQSGDAVRRGGGGSAVGADDAAAADSTSREEEPPVKRRVSDTSCSAGGLRDPCSTEVQDDRGSVQQSRQSHQTTESRDDKRCENVRLAQNAQQEPARKEKMREKEEEKKAATNVEKQGREKKTAQCRELFSKQCQRSQNIEVDVIIKSKSDHVIEQQEREERIATPNQKRETSSGGGEEKEHRTKGKGNTGKVAAGSDKLNHRHDGRQVYSQPKANREVKTSQHVAVSEEGFTAIPSSSSSTRKESQKQNDHTDSASVSKNEEEESLWKKIKQSLNVKDRKK
ncbi:probable ubiquitin carboxyl-terminal hydrolase creB isoform X2 [Salarias fasciatus]|uniref:probable ubiquitin carboxyl-terminal hydrolase creB isoform X2 n=1 Tax=Salarias fasciatus TaxID=181472 RepID=UPI001176D5D5|nr:probable ubiquitin carboxyl-terminal hydrolase creB isoform X2 [Salarias fasciatus]